jgi:tetratricopeptide (TPR) repeat protein
MSKKRPRANPIASRGTRIGVCVFLVGITWLVFGQTLRHEFINYDDPVYVYENPVVASGLTLHGIGWAFTHSHGGNWHPLTSISHMLDCQFYGLKAGGHHFTNVLLHTIAVLLLFLLLIQMTGALWRSAFVAAVFAIHPLHVESVAWVAERKDVLSGVFFMLTLIAYVRYARSLSLGRYATMSVLFACGLMAKPMLVTIPFVLLLLDYWPLGRFAQSTNSNTKAAMPRKDWPRIRQLIFEKIPLFALSAASCIATLLAQEKALGSVKHFPLGLRAGNALVTCMTYIRQMIWPAELTPFYSYPGGRVPLWEVIFASVALVVITAVAFALRKTRPYLMTGWFWYLGMLVPVIGLIQVGLQGHADRYTYLPQIGLYLLATWTISDLSISWRHQRQILGIAAALVIAALTFRTWNQTSHWHDTESLWRYALTVNSDSDVAHNNFGNAVLRKGRIDEAILHYQRVLEIRPGHIETDRREAYYNLGNALLRKGKIDEAIANYREALEVPSEYEPEAHSGLGNALLRKGQIDEAILHFEKFVQLRPDHAEAYYNLGNALLQKGRVDDAVAHFEKALKLNPVLAEAENNLGNALFRKGQMDEAILHFQKFLELCLDRGDGDRAEGHYNLGNALLQKGQIGEAIAHYREAVKLRPDYAEAQNNLAGVLLQEGRVDEAILHYQKVLELRPDREKAHYNLGNALLQKEKGEEAIAQYEKALQIDPRSISALNQLAWVLATNSEAQIRNGAKAIELARQADQLSGGKNPIILHTLAAAYAESGQFSQAVETAQDALKLAVIEGNTALAEALRQVIGLYQMGKSYHQAQR